MGISIDLCPSQLPGCLPFTIMLPTPGRTALMAWALAFSRVKEIYGHLRYGSFGGGIWIEKLRRLLECRPYVKLG